MKTSELIKAMTTNGRHDKRKAFSLYEIGRASAFELSRAKWIGIIKGVFDFETASSKSCGFCFENRQCCDTCFLDNSLVGGGCVYLEPERAVDTLKNIVKQYRKHLKEKGMK